MIKISMKTKQMLDAMKIHPRETYEDILMRLVEFTMEKRK